MDRTPGILLVHKPVGATSFSIVRALMEEVARQGAQRWPLCHGGTLDPFAQGLLPILSGAATRLFDHLHGAPKTYRAEVRWGEETDNGDPTGKVIARGDAAALTPEAIEAAVGPLLGWTLQVPPSTSAKKLGGEPAYRKVHRGELVELPPSRVYLHEVRWLSHRLPQRSEVELVCRGGYYVRSFARELGRALGARAHLGALHRTAIGPWRDPEEGTRPLLVGPAVLPWARRRELTDAEVGALRKGESISAAPLLPPQWAVPEGFPDPETPVLGLHRGRVLMLLRLADDRLALGSELRGGI